MTYEEAVEGKYVLITLRTMPNWDPKYREAMESTHLGARVTEYISRGHRADHSPIAVVWDDEGRPVLVLKPW
jgi:hypothetical protein